MSTTSMAIFSNPLLATYSVYARNASIYESACMQCMCDSQSQRMQKTACTLLYETIVSYWMSLCLFSLLSWL